MGGIGSGVKRTRKTAVEECLKIAVSTHLRAATRSPVGASSGVWRWHNGQGDTTAVVGYAVKLEGDEGWLRLFYEARGEVIQRVIQLRTSMPTYGGLRWWFVCPATGRWTTKLYLPPGGDRWVSRQGGVLTYMSCRESGRYRGLFAAMAKRTGTDASEIRKLVSDLGRENGLCGRVKSGEKVCDER
jgi:hypothetical protein